MVADVFVSSFKFYVFIFTSAKTLTGTFFLVKNCVLCSVELTEILVFGVMCLYNRYCTPKMNECSLKRDQVEKRS